MYMFVHLCVCVHLYICVHIRAGNMSSQSIPQSVCVYDVSACTMCVGVSVLVKKKRD